MTVSLVKRIQDRLAVLEGRDFDHRHGVLAADYTLTSTTSTQKLFNWTTNGALTLPTGAYAFQAILYITGMDATSGNAAFALRGGGSATVANILYQTSGADAATPTNAGTLSGLISVNQSSAAPYISGTVQTSNALQINGTFEVTAVGTIIPSIALTVAAAAVVKAGSYFRCTRLGAAGAVYSGVWS